MQLSLNGSTRALSSFWRSHTDTWLIFHRRGSRGSLSRACRSAPRSVARLALHAAQRKHFLLNSLISDTYLSVGHAPLAFAGRRLYSRSEGMAQRGLAARRRPHGAPVGPQGSDFSARTRDRRGREDPPWRTSARGLLGGA
jgi:hypothetical protein